jgi:hypothetical protein
MKMFIHSTIAMCIVVISCNIMQAQTSMNQFMGVNLLREDPLKYVNCVGFAREYHEWQIDEGDVYVTNGASLAYPFNKFKWDKPYSTYTKFPAFYKNIASNMGINSPILPICVSMKSCLPRLAGGSGAQGGAPMEFKPVLSNESYQTILSSGACEYSNWNNATPGVNLYNVSPCPERNTQNPTSYLEYADWVTHFAKAFGKNTTSTPDFNNIYFKKDPIDVGTQIGLNRIGYLEIWNEQDKDWFNLSGASHNMAEFTAKEYAAMSSFAYDGWNQWAVNERSPTNVKAAFENTDNAYKVGVKFGADLNTNAETFKYVFGGLSDIDTKHTEYVDSVLQWCNDYRNGADKIFPFDVINFHHYSDNNSQGVNELGGVSPESDYMTDVENGWNTVPEKVTIPAENGSSALEINKTLKYRLRELYQIFKGEESVYPKGLELWLSEFGYDTNEKSPQRVPVLPAKNTMPIADQQEVQGRWIVRSYLEIAAAKWEKAMVFFLRDINSNASSPGGFPEGLFQSSGLVLDKANGFAPKKSYFYVHTLKTSIGSNKYSQELSAFDQNSVTNGNFKYWERWKYLIDANKPRVYYFCPQNDATFGETTYPTLVQNGAVAVWLPTSDNSSLINYKLRFQNFPSGVTSVRVTEMQATAVNGYAYTINVQTDTDGKKYIILPKVSEKPLFIKFANSNTFQAQDPLTCVNFLNSKAVSCDAVQVEWSAQTGVNNYLVYYYDKRDSDEANDVIFNINDTNWKLYADNIAGNSTNVLIGGLDKLQDNYRIAVIPISSAGLTPPPTSICTYRVQKTASCFGGIDNTTILGLNPGNSIVATLFNYDGATLCQPSRTTYNDEWDGSGTLSTIIKLDNSTNGTAKMIVDGISIFDGSGEGSMFFTFDKDNINSNGNELTIPYFTESYNIWKTLPVPNNAGFARVIITMNEATARIRRLKLYGRPANIVYPTTLNCCSPSGVLHIGATGNSINSATFNALIGNNTKAIIKGNIKIDADFNITNKMLLMENEAAFLIQSGKTLQVNQSTLQGCDLMWEGITIEPGGNLMVDGSNLRDAYQAVKVNRRSAQGSQPLTYFSIKNSYFEANFEGINIKANNIKSDISSLISVEGTLFDGMNTDLREPYPSIANNWSAMSQCGITASSLNKLTIKNLPQGTYSNPTIFNRILTGICGNDVSLDVINTVFRDIQIRPLFPISGRGIYLTNSNLYQRGLGKVVYSGYALDAFFNALSFKNVLTPIYLGNNCAFDIANNTMWEVGDSPNAVIYATRNGFNARSSTGSSTIKNNSIVMSQNGIVLNDLEYPVIVEGNNIHNYSNRTTIGLRASGYGMIGQGVPQRVDFRHNEFKIRSAPTVSPAIGAGIYLSNLYNPNIEANKVTIENYQLINSTTPSIYGVYSNAVTDATFCRNNINGWSRRYGNGIHFENTSNSDLVSNTIGNVRNGLSFAAISTNAERLKCNTLQDDGHGIRIANTTLLGKQTEKQNCWTGTYSALSSPYDPDLKYAVYWDGAHTQASLVANQIKVAANGQTCWNPTLTSVVPETTDFFNATGTLNSSICTTDTTQMPCFNNHLSFANTQQGAIGYSYASSQASVPDTWSPALRFIMDREVYRDLKEQYKETSEIPEDLKGFVEEKSNKNVGAFYLVDKAMEQIFTNTPDLKSELELISLKIGNQELNFKDKLNAFLALSDQDKKSFLQQSNNDALSENSNRYIQLATLVTKIAAIRKDAINQAITLNDAINCEDYHEKAEQTINRIYLTSLQIDSLTQEQMLEVSPIADDCPQNAGIAVFRARDLFVRYFGYHKAIWDNCDTPDFRAASGERNEQSQSPDSTFKVAIFPNPTVNLFTIVTNATKATKLNLQFYNATGQLLINQNSIGNVVDLDVAQYESGFYFLRIKNEIGERLIEKVLIGK